VGNDAVRYQGTWGNTKTSVRLGEWQNGVKRKSHDEEHASMPTTPHTPVPTTISPTTRARRIFLFDPQREARVTVSKL